jgi:hypothetical protein
MTPMTDIFDAIQEVRTNPRLGITFISNIIRLAQNLMEIHGVFRGTHEAVLAEAQGGELIDSAGQVVNHLASLQQSRQTLINREADIQANLTQLERISRTLSSVARDVVKPLLEFSRNNRALMTETEDEAAQLLRTAPTRLQGVPLGTGGLGPEVARDANSLISSQLAAQANQLAARGIDPQLISNATAAEQALLDRIRDQAINNQDTVAKMTPIIAAMRLAAQAALRQAAFAVRMLLNTILDGLIAALDALAASMGSMLVTPLIFPKNMTRFLGQSVNDEA